MERILLKELRKVVQKTVLQTPIFDIHTHLFPQSHTKYFLSGMDDILTYHYLTTEFLSTTGYSPEKFFAYSKEQRAQIIWDELFVKRTPISEAARGVVTILNASGVEGRPMAYAQLKRKFLDVVHNDPEWDVFRLCNVARVVMTNDPFDREEWSLFMNDNWDQDNYLSSVRLDSLYAASEEAMERVKGYGFADTARRATLTCFFDRIFKESNAHYFSLTINGNFLRTLLHDDMFVKTILPWLEVHNIPLALMIGVKRTVNPAFCLGGDGIGTVDTEALELLAVTYPRNRFLVTVLSETYQHEITVLARKFSNLNIFGFWWFANQPSIIRQKLALRIELLGFNFVPHFSDARVFEHLIYKWLYFKEILIDVLYEHYRKLLNVGWELTVSDIERDVRMLLYENAENYLKYGK